MKILLAIDDSDNSAAATRAVIAQFPPQRTEVRVLHADEWPRGLPLSMAFAEGSAAAHSILSLHEIRKRDAHALVDGAGRKLRAAGFATTTSVRDGDARTAILDEAAAWHPDLIVLGSRGRKGFDRMLLGSVSDSVARHADCSIEIVRQGPPAAPVAKEAP